MKSREEWEIIFENCKQSGLSISKFCQQQNIKTNSFYNARGRFYPTKKKKKNCQKKEKTKIEFASLPVSQTLKDSPTIRITSKNGDIWDLFI